MAGNFTQQHQAEVMNYRFGGYSTLVAESTMWVHLYHTTLNDAATPATTGRVGTTAAGDNYNPVSVPNTTSSWTAPTTASPSATENKLVLTFTTNASTGWNSPIKAILITSSSGTGGVSIAWADLSAQQTVSVGNTVRVSTGAIDITLT